MTTRTGHQVTTPGSTLDVNDFVRDRGTWYKLVELEASTRFSRRFLGVAKDGARRHIQLDSANVVAYRWDR